MDSSRSLYQNTVLRWLLVLPGALGVALLVQFPLHWGVLGLTREGSFVQIQPQDAAALERALVPLASAFGFVYGGARVAPAKRLCTSVFLAVFLIVSMQVLLFATGRTTDSWSLHPALMMRAIVFHVIGAGLGVSAIIIGHGVKHATTQA
jgi:hypothetical protein